ncbi:YhcN/YlaJ family sporulation lipoprotein [Bacillus xiapuensis]|uniref:YhcN/YlaJ family sporulation lipoprotein n=1 Tax=Bacillus xiapuensis TaxID=2014075 RepID=UPI000C242826|nr:YhcN/YlaJ family sporulation lipoprotein [Bacillus xiapuensis]
MKKMRKLLILPVLAMGLAACNDGNESGFGGDRSLDQAGDRFSDERGKDGAGNAPNPTVPLAEEDRSLLERDNEHPRSRDINYHGNRGLRENTTKSSYYTNYDGKLAEQLSAAAKNVSGVKDARAFINGKDVLVAVHLQNEGKEERTVKKRVQKAIAPHANGYTLRVTTDHASYSRLRNLDNDLRDGGPIDLPDARYSK